MPSVPKDHFSTTANVAGWLMIIMAGMGVVVLVGQVPRAIGRRRRMKRLFDE